MMPTKKEIIHKWLNDNNYSGMDGMPKAMDEYGKLQAIEFKEWCRKNGQFHGSPPTAKTDEQLYTMYFNEQTKTQ